MQTADHPAAFWKKLGHPGGWLSRLRRLALQAFVGRGHGSECAQDELTTIATSTADALFLLGADGRITYANPAAEKTLGWKASELTGTKLREMVHCSCDRARACPHSVNGLFFSDGGDPEKPSFSPLVVLPI